MGWTTDALWTLPVITLVLYLGVQWWASWYPGAEPGGGGYVAQRMFSAKDEKNSLGATLWFNIANYAMRSWPWVVTGLVAVAVYSPYGGLHPSAEFAAEPEKGYVMVLRDFLPPALRGLMVAAFLAAFMSTVGTQLNWGTSYFINDFYRRFVVRKGSEKHYVLLSKLFIVLLVILSGYTAAHITSIQSAWQLLLGNGCRNRRRADAALVLVARKCLERNLRDGRRVRRIGFTPVRRVFRKQLGGLREDRTDHHRGYDRRVARHHSADASRSPTSAS